MTAVNQVDSLLAARSKGLLRQDFIECGYSVCDSGVSAPYTVFVYLIRFLHK